VTAAARWTDGNRALLLAQLRRVQSHLDPPGAQPDRASTDGLQRDIEELRGALPAPAALDVLTTNFSLTSFERDLLLLCAGVELDSAFASKVRAVSGTGQPTFALAANTLPAAHWSAMSTGAPLRRHRLLELSSNEAIVNAGLRIDERILHFLVGVDCIDERLAPYLDEVSGLGGHEASDGYGTNVEMLAARWHQAAQQGAAPVAILCGEDETARRLVAAAACARLGVRAFALRAADLPGAPVEREALVRAWERESLLELRALLIEVDDGDGPEARRNAAAVAERAPGLVAVSCRESFAVPRRQTLRIELDRPDPVFQRNLLRRTLTMADGISADRLDPSIDRVLAQFSLGAAALEAIAAEVRARLSPQDPPADVDATLWTVCRAYARPRIESLAQRVEAVAGWDDLVLPVEQRRTLQEIATSVRQRARVYDTWGFAKKGSRGLGISALFAGASGTGKTMAAEVVARDLRLDLFRIDLSQIVSKYIGETEKNLRKIFDAAEGGGAILLFDEADALFGKRSEVKDSHDRYANVEISYLLQRMETYRGLAVLTSNMRNALDAAFLRRVRYVVEFPFPDAQHRAEIWRRAFPTETPTADLDYARLARLPIAGGNIRNIALQGAFLAADSGQPVKMEHLARAARTEFAKMERPLGDVDLGVPS
jgi:hypothetical protein